MAVAMCRMYYYNGGKFDSGPCLWLTAAVLGTTGLLEVFVRTSHVHGHP